jgi:hypothetical protein
VKKTNTKKESSEEAHRKKLENFIFLQDFQPTDKRRKVVQRMRLPTDVN